jgi:hypothetical protein
MLKRAITTSDLQQTAVIRRTETEIEAEPCRVEGKIK